MKEKDVENSILDFLSLLKNCFAWKNQNVGIYDAKRGVYRKPKGRHQFAGISDIIGIYNGMPLFIEVKTPKNKKRTTEAQELFLAKVKEQGAIAFVASSIKDVIAELELYEKEKPE